MLQARKKETADRLAAQKRERDAIKAAMAQPNPNPGPNLNPNPNPNLNTNPHPNPHPKPHPHPAQAAMARDRGEVAARGPAEASVAKKLPGGNTSGGMATSAKFQEEEDAEDRRNAR